MGVAFQLVGGGGGNVRGGGWGWGRGPAARTRRRLPEGGGAALRALPLNLRGLGPRAAQAPQSSTEPSITWLPQSALRLAGGSTRHIVDQQSVMEHAITPLDPPASLWEFEILPCDSEPAFGQMFSSSLAQR